MQQTEQVVEQQVSIFKFFELFKNREYVLVVILLIVVPLFVYAQVYNFEFVWDDQGNDTMGHMQNPYIKNYTLDNLLQLFLKPFFGMYIPITYFLWGSIKWLADLLELPVSSVLHLSNVLLHIINGILVFVIIKQFINNKFAVLIASLFFLLHPIQVESVAWVSEFRGLLASSLLLVALYYYMKNSSNVSFFALFLLLLALLSKPSATVLPLFILVINHFHYNFSIKQNIIKALPYIVIVITGAIVTYIIQSSMSVSFFEYSITYWLRPFVWLYSIVFYLYKIIFPYYLGASYVLSPQFIVQQWWVYPLALIPLMLGGVLYFLRHKHNLLVLACVLFVVGFLPTSGFVDFAFQKYSLVADRYVYLAFIGVSLAIAFVLERADKKYLFVVFIGVLLVCAFLSAFRQIPIWKNQTKLWTHSRDMEVTPSYAESNLRGFSYNKGLELANSGKIEDALVYFDDVISNYPKNQKYEPKYSDLFYNRGVIMVIQKKYKNAVIDFTKAIEINENYTAAYNGRITAYFNLKQYKNTWADVSKIRELGVEPATETLTKLQKICPDGDC